MTQSVSRADMFHVLPSITESLFLEREREMDGGWKGHRSQSHRNGRKDRMTALESAGIDVVHLEE